MTSKAMSLYFVQLRIAKVNTKTPTTFFSTCIEIAQAFGKKLGCGAHVSVFKNFGTAQVKFKDTEVEFVGARKESYSHDSRKPIVEDGTLEDEVLKKVVGVFVLTFDKCGKNSWSPRSVTYC